MATPPDFTAGQVLTAAQMNQIGLWHVSRTTIGSGVASVTVSNAFSADYDTYQIVVSGGVASTICSLNLHLDGLTSGYQYAYLYTTYASGGEVINNSSSAASWVSIGEGTTTDLTAQLTLGQPFAAKRKTINYSNGYSGVYLHGAGMNPSTSSYTGFVVTTSTGTMTGGYVDVYGFRGP